MTGMVSTSPRNGSTAAEDVESELRETGRDTTHTKREKDQEVKQFLTGQIVLGAITGREMGKSGSVFVSPLAFSNLFFKSSKRARRDSLR